MNKNISNITKPHQCVLGFGIPITDKAFRVSLNNANKDYSNRFTQDRYTYSVKILEPFKNLVPVLKKTGVTVIEELTIEIFQSLFTKYDVIILFSHWRENQIEFYEGMIPIEKIVDAIPPDYNGIIDFSVCHPKAISKLIRAKKLNCTTRYSISKLEKPAYWLYFYSRLFIELNRNNWYYFDAFREIIFKHLNARHEE